jgi:hypothetical protein
MPHREPIIMTCLPLPWCNPSWLRIRLASDMDATKKYFLRLLRVGKSGQASRRTVPPMSPLRAIERNEPSSIRQQELLSLLTQVKLSAGRPYPSHLHDYTNKSLFGSLSTD